MNAPLRPDLRPPTADAASLSAPTANAAAATLADLAFALLAPTHEYSPAAGAAAPAGNAASGAGAEAAWLAECAARVDIGALDVAAWLSRWRAAPPPADRRLVALSATLQLTLAEEVAVAIARAAETDAMAARVLAWLQAPVGGARPTVGLAAQVAAALGEPYPFPALATGVARRSGLLHIDDDHRALPEATLTVPQPIVFALSDPPALQWPGLRIGRVDDTPLPPSLQDAARSRAQALGRGASAVLVVRSGHPKEAQAAAAEVARQLRARAVFIEGDVPEGLGPWLWLAAAVPVVSLELAPGERRRVAAIPGWHGPLLVAAGPDGSIEFNGDTAPGWSVPIPPAEERTALWLDALGDAGFAQALGHRHCHAAGRIAELGRAARFEAQSAGAETVTPAHVVQAARGGSAGDLGALAELLDDPVPDEALVLPAPLRAELDAFADRCLARDTAARGLGPAMRARFRTGVRGLFVGPSGTGKSLAVGWLATRLGLPLYRVDLASVTSKYIGETEKNLAQLFARAEHAEVVLMFDEADSLFGKRTDVKDSNDRFANAQTNYLLSRIESYAGIAVLTSNSRARFESAFTRRLDVIVEFPPPGPTERRALWLAHLGDGHRLDGGTVNQLAAGCELAGGHVRNVVLAAAARTHGGPVGAADLLPALVAEYGKLGKPLPAALRALASDGAAPEGP
ncbi:ATP-binding protein [Roseateles noduli]|uniref:ATP-binding protein n=1 Tax=Roseateles noduli TaxID=2052484 RepID=UPI003D64C9EA